MDRIVELYSGSLTYAQLVAGVNLITPAVGETAIIRDLAVSCQNPIGIDFSIGPDLVASTYDTVRLTGSEVVPHGKSLRATGDLYFGPNRVHTLDSSSYRAFRRRTTFGIPQPSSALLTNEIAQTISPSFSNVPTFFCISPANHLYYAVQGGGSVIRKRTGNFNGADTNLTVGVAPVYDGTRYIYAWENGTSNLRRLDTQNDTITSISAPALLGSDSAVMSMSFIDGHLFVRRSHAGNDQMVLVNVTTGAAVIIGNDVDANTARLAAGIGRRRDGDYIAIVARTGSGIPNATWFNLGPVLGSAAAVSRGSVNINWLSVSDNGVGMVRNPLRADILVQASGANLSEISVESLGEVSRTLMQTNTIGFSGSVLPAYDTSLASNEMGTVRVRVTGILTTED
ncbi:hypothetical protein [Pannonibacter tanglangensis]|uniref:Uncharacterized protein n=1 Tax=Pannonibacter tanglangensis TaxID=2750084 RepID=A0ABW9ZD64_9HYPH|nr:hypothetical protein [Pannonibacter sp. XCT-34]NBN62779.1 hypothetical protein [Pannonibacter sp. XCT-34]